MSQRRNLNHLEKYFTKPSLQSARKRGREEIQVERDAFEIPEDMVNIGVDKYYLIRTYGCQMNEHDSEVMMGILESLGYKQTIDVEQADIVLLNTCAVRETAEDKVFGELGHLKHLKKQKPELLLGLCGCMSQEEDVVSRILQKHQHVDIIFGTHNIHRLPQIIKEAYMSKEMVIEVWSKEGDIIENLPKSRIGQKKAWVNIAYGCDKFCTYCIIPYTRGKERSRMPEDILEEVKQLVADGYQEVTLLGQNVNSYGRDLTDLQYTFADLLQDVADLHVPRIRFTTSHPWEFTDEMINAIAQNDNIMPHVHLPVQSGNSQVLRRMGRHYTREEYLELYNKIRTQVKNVAITTDIIVGFPNETDEQFADTLSLVSTCEFDSAFTFIYSQREGTPAANKKDDVPHDVKRKRLQELNAYVNASATKRNAEYQGQVVEVLVDGVSKKNDQVLSGYIGQNKLVNFPGSIDLIGQLVQVKITEAKTWSLNGELVNA